MELVKSSIERRKDAIKERLVFGEAAAEMGLAGSSRAGWDCPACCSPRTVKERRDEQGGLCSACGKGFDIISIVMTARGESFLGALGLLEALADKSEASAALKGFGGAGDLFGGGA